LFADRSSQFTRLAADGIASGTEHEWEDAAPRQHSYPTPPAATCQSGGHSGSEFHFIKLCAVLPDQPARLVLVDCNDGRAAEVIAVWNCSTKMAAPLSSAMQKVPAVRCLVKRPDLSEKAIAYEGSFEEEDQFGRVGVIGKAIGYLSHFEKSVLNNGRFAVRCLPVSGYQIADN
jgi:hypothetical protein